MGIIRTIYLVNLIAQLYKSFYNNFFLTINKDKLIENILKAFINNSSFFTLIFAAFYAFTLALVAVSVLDLSDIYININLQKAIKLILELFIKD